MKLFNRNTIMLTLAACLCFTACDKKLDQKPAGSLFDTEAIKDFQTLQAATLGAYSSFLSLNWYGRNYPTMLELRGADMYIAARNSNRLITSYMYLFTSSDADVTGTWNDLYNTILRANQIINRGPNVTDGDANERARNIGEAKFIRAYAYFDLVRVFAKQYTFDNGASLGVPIVTEAKISSPSRNTVADVYNLVISDLQAAATVLPDDITLKYRASKYAAEALLARVYLYKGDNDNARAMASDVINAGYTLTPPGSYNPDNFWGSPGHEEEIFTIKVSQFQDRGSDNYGQLYEKELGGYGDVVVNPNFVSTYDPNDVRLNVIKVDAVSGKLITTKFYMQDHIPGLYSPKVLRLAEMYFIRAEADVRSGSNLGEALSDINTVRAARNVGDFVGTPTLTDVLTEKNYEFAFEGFQWQDNLRNQIVTNRPQPAGALNNQGSSSLDVNDNRQLYPIPQREIDANPGIKGQQNPGY